jgi:hypothetical protein
MSSDYYRAWFFIYFDWDLINQFDGYIRLIDFQFFVLGGPGRGGAKAPRPQVCALRGERSYIKTTVNELGTLFLVWLGFDWLIYLRGLIDWFIIEVGRGGAEQRLPAHKFVLSVGSAVFDAMFNSTLATQVGM